MKIKKHCAKIARKVPILGELHLATGKNHLEASRELATSLVISLAPVSLGAFALYLGQEGEKTFSLFECARQIVGDGELFINAAAVLAPVIYIATKDRDKSRPFPGKFAFICIVLGVAMVSAVVFTLQRVNSQSFTSGEISFSFWLLLFSILTFYCALVYNDTWAPDASDLMRDNDKRFTDDLQKSRKGDQA